MTAPPRKARRPLRLPRAVAQRALELQSDERLVALVHDGSDPAFEAIVRRYRAPLLRYSRRLLPPERAEDVVQQTFINTLGALREEERRLSLRPWLYRVAHNLTLNAVAKKGFDHEPLDPQHDGVPQPPDVVDERQRLEHVMRAIGALPGRQRSAVVMRELEGRSYDEIARELDATPAVVRQLLHRARNRLRDACGLLLPLPVLRALSSVQTPPERVAEVVAGGGAGLGIAKTGATVLAAGVIAAGAGVSVPRHAGTNDRPRAAADAAAAPTGRDATSSAPGESSGTARGEETVAGALDGQSREGGVQAGGGGATEAARPKREGESDDGDEGSRHLGSGPSDDGAAGPGTRKRHSERADEGDDDEGEGHVAEAEADEPSDDGRRPQEFDSEGPSGSSGPAGSNSGPSGSGSSGSSGPDGSAGGESSDP